MRVGKRSKALATAAVETLAGTLKPPSQGLPLAPRSKPAEPPSSPRQPQGPLSLVKKTSVFSPRPKRRGVGKMQKEGPRLMTFNELDRLGGEPAGQQGLVGALFDGRLAIKQRQRRKVLPRIVPVLVFGPHVVGVEQAEKAVEAVPRRQELRQVAQMPLADEAGCVVPRLQGFRQGGLRCWQAAAGVREQNASCARHAAAHRQPSGQQAGPAGRAERICRVELGELHAFPRQSGFSEFT